MTTEPTLVDLPACPVCGVATLVDVLPEAWHQWQDGAASTRQAFPTLYDGDVHLLEHGTHPNCTPRTRKDPLP